MVRRNRRNVASTRPGPGRCDNATVAGQALGPVPGGGRDCQGGCGGWDAKEPARSVPVKGAARSVPVKGAARSVPVKGAARSVPVKGAARSFLMAVRRYGG